MFDSWYAPARYRFHARTPLLLLTLSPDRNGKDGSHFAADRLGAGSTLANHISHPACPFSQRLEILLSLKGLEDRVEFHVVDITKPRENWLLQKTRGTTALPVLDPGNGRIIKESLVILRYLEELFPESAVAQRDPYRRAVENMMTAMEGPFVSHGYRYVMNQDATRRDDFKQGCWITTPA